MDVGAGALVHVLRDAPDGAEADRGADIPVPRRDWSETGHVRGKMPALRLSGDQS